MRTLSIPWLVLPYPFAAQWTLDHSSPGSMSTTNALLKVHLNSRTSALQFEIGSATDVSLLACDLIQNSDLSLAIYCVLIASIQTNGLLTKERCFQCGIMSRK